MQETKSIHLHIDSWREVAQIERGGGGAAAAASAAVAALEAAAAARMI